ncbi:MAG TPA: hypothetical protein VJ418_05045 [Streptosporangiaceae bacterium]|nr:hypothetical protein [Streptosporangiaceae bacterium]
MSYLKYPYVAALDSERTIIRGRVPGYQQKLVCSSLAPITQEKRSEERTYEYVNFQAGSIALPPDAAGAVGRPDQAIISNHPSSQQGTDT